MIKKLRSILGCGSVISFYLVHRARWAAQQTVALPAGSQCPSDLCAKEGADDVF